MTTHERQFIQYIPRTFIECLGIRNHIIQKQKHTECIILEDLQSTVSEVQDNLRTLTHNSIKEGAQQKWEREQLKTSFAEYQKSMTQQMEQYAQRIQDLETKLSEVKDETATSSESSIWEINSISSEQDHEAS